MTNRSNWGRFFNQFEPLNNSYNEILSKDTKAVSPVWETLQATLSELGESAIEKRSNNMLRLLKENGVAYNIYDDPSGQTRPWELDPIPQIITGEEWDFISKGLIQRARLFNLILKDLYGPQSLVKDRIIPQEIIYRHPGFLRNCVGINLPEESYLTLYATDMARGSDGRLWIINDRTQAPSGYGYALENRFVVNSVLPELFSKIHVRRISPFFEALQESLNQIAPGHNRQPRIVILSPGPENETYFEHSYLSIHLGFTLVQGSDLMIKDNFVWLKTIEGLEKVDVILRRMDDSYCDPLELRSESVLGVPGLLQAVRKGNVAIANALGSSIIENAGLMPFLQSAAKYLLNESLLIPSIATWWCGQPREMEYVINNISHLVIRKIFRREAGTRSAIDGASLNEMERQQLIEDIKANPSVFSGQEKINFSSTPSWIEGKMQTGHSLIRSFLVRKNDTYIAMPGGLTRTSHRKDHFIISNQSGGVSKDTWVISSGSVQTQPVKLQLQQADALQAYEKSSLPSQTAENLFWAGRYTQRMVNHARLLKTVIQYLMQHNFENDRLYTNTRKIMLQALTHCTYSYPGFTNKDEKKEARVLDNPWPLLIKNLYDKSVAGSLSQNLNSFVRSVYNVRSFLSLDSWRTIQQINTAWGNRPNKARRDHLVMINDIDKINTSLFAFLGMNRESSRREQEWSILESGRKFEQALFTIRLLQCCFVQKEDDQTETETISLVLDTLQSRITYRYTFRDHLQLPLLFELLIFDSNYPKSLNYTIERIKMRIFSMPKISKNISKSEMEKLIAEAQNLIAMTDSATLSRFDSEHRQYSELQALLVKLSDILYKIHHLFSKTYFRHTATPQQLYVTNVL